MYYVYTHTHRGHDAYCASVVRSIDAISGIIRSDNDAGFPDHLDSFRDISDSSPALAILGTSTMCLGLNLPAQFVLIIGVERSMLFILQMIGRLRGGGTSEGAKTLAKRHPRVLGSVVSTH